MDYQSISNEELEKMVANKDGEAICELGERFLYGKNGSPQNLTRAYQLFHKGEKRGLARAYVGLGEMYRQGLLMVKNENLAREYYQKANVPYPNGTPMGAAPVYQEQEDDMPPIQEEDPVYPRKQPAERPQYTAVPEVPVNTNTKVITDRDLAIRLDEAEKSREKGNFDYVKQICQEVFRDIAGVKNGIFTYQGNAEISDFEIQANWIMAFRAYNQENYQEMETYLLQENVTGLYPWGWYLKATSDKIMHQPDIVIEQDLQSLIMVCQNKNLSQSERGDVNVMIADLIMEGYGKANGANEEMAKKHYLEAINCENDYAKEQYAVYGF